MPASGNFVIPRSHPALAGHFPANPVVPGVVILDEVFDTLATHMPDAEVVGLASVKFLVPLKPDILVRVELLEKSDSLVEFCCYCEAQKVALGQIKVIHKATE